MVDYEAIEETFREHYNDADETYYTGGYGDNTNYMVADVPDETPFGIGVIETVLEEHNAICTKVMKIESVFRVWFQTVGTETREVEKTRMVEETYTEEEEVLALE